MMTTELVETYVRLRMFPNHFGEMDFYHKINYYDLKKQNGPSPTLDLHSNEIYVWLRFVGNIVTAARRIHHFLTLRNKLLGTLRCCNFNKQPKILEGNVKTNLVEYFRIIGCKPGLL